ncbi:MAG TPA: radical SAM protein [Gammaproteobacteria bacterium]|nr:radical SAM protein [Gammaproteobacteria bacterium]
MKRMRIGIIDVLYDMPPSNGGYQIYRNQLRRQFVSIMPQVISVWCRRMGHDVHYATYYGQAEPHTLLPDDLDILFVSSYTQASALAYALARIFGARGTRTVIGGPHARAFPADCQRFFDLVVGNCDETVIRDILAGHYAPGSIIDTGRTLTEIPSVEERMPELRATTLSARFAVLRVVPLLSSMGCPYTCNFCSDATSTYHAVGSEILKKDLQYIADNIPGAYVVYHDPNFGVRFDETMAAIESLPPKQRPAYGVQSTLSVLKEERVRRLADTGCLYIAPGVESWSDFSNKSGKVRATGRDKMEQVVGHFEMMRRHVPGFQVNFVFGTDADQGRAPVELTSEFIRRVPYAWPGISIPTPFGDTGIFTEYLEQNRVLTQMPFALYYKPYLNFIPLHYGAMEYYESLMEILSSIVSLRGALSRLTTRNLLRIKGIHMVQLTGVYHDLRRVRELYRLLKGDALLRRFHEGLPMKLPAVYEARTWERLGRYAELFQLADLIPDLINTSCKRVSSPASVNVEVATSSLGVA